MSKEQFTGLQKEISELLGSLVKLTPEINDVVNRVVQEFNQENIQLVYQIKELRANTYIIHNDGGVDFFTKSGVVSYKKNDDGTSVLAIFEGSITDFYTRADYIPGLRIKHDNQNSILRLSAQRPVVFSNGYIGVQLIEEPKVLTLKNPILIHLDYTGSVIGEENTLLLDVNDNLTLIRTFNTIVDGQNTIRRTYTSIKLLTTEKKKVGDMDFLLKKCFAAQKYSESDSILNEYEEITGYSYRLFQNNKSMLNVKVELMNDSENGTKSFGEFSVSYANKQYTFNYFDLVSKGLAVLEQDPNYPGALKSIISIPDTRLKLTLALENTGKIAFASIS